MSALIVIPAKGQSTRVPRKNLAPLLGRPLLAWTVDAARESKLAERIVVSTEDADIAGVARGLGVEVIDRPPQLSEGETLSGRAVQHATKAVIASGFTPEFVVELLPSCAVRPAGCVDAVLTAMRERDAVTGCVVAPVGEQHPVWLYSVRDGLAERAFPGMEILPNSADLTPYHYVTGAAFAIRTEALLAPDNPGTCLHYPGRCAAVLCAPSEAVDVDAPDSLVMAELAITRTATMLFRSKDNGSVREMFQLTDLNPATWPEWLRLGAELEVKDGCVLMRGPEYYLSGEVWRIRLGDWFIKNEKCIGMCLREVVDKYFTAVPDFGTQPISVLRGAHPGATCCVVGMGPTLLTLTAESFPADAVVVAMNHAIIHVEKLGLTCPVYSIQKDGFCVRPQRDPLIVHELEAHADNSPDYRPRYIFQNPRDFGLEWYRPSVVTSTALAHYLGCRRVKLYACDALHTGDCRRIEFNPDGSHYIGPAFPGYTAPTEKLQELERTLPMPIDWGRP